MLLEIGAKIKAARQNADLTQEQAAEYLGVTRQTISNWENEKTYPDIVSVVKMSSLYNVSLDHLLKEGAPEKGHLNYLEESTNTVKSKKKIVHDHPDFNIPWDMDNFLGCLLAFQQRRCTRAHDYVFVCCSAGHDPFRLFRHWKK